MKRVSAALVILFLCAWTVQAQTAPAPTAEHKKLGVFLGTWSGAGKMEASPFGKAGALKSTMTCKWYTGGFHLICDAEDNGPMGKSTGHSINGYDTEKKQYYDFGIESTGFGGPGTATVDGSTWTFSGDATMGGKKIWFRTVVKVASPTEITYKGEFSEDGKTWKPQSEGKLAKKP